MKHVFNLNADTPPESVSSEHTNQSVTSLYPAIPPNSSVQAMMPERSASRRHTDSGHGLLLCRCLPAFLLAYVFHFLPYCLTQVLSRLQSRWLRLSVVLASLMMTPVLALATMPLAGTIIGTQALATYIPAHYSQTESIQSNMVTSVVLAVEGVTLTQDQPLFRPPHAIITASSTLRNTGNVASQYTFTLTANSPACAASTFNLTSVAVWLDVNSNGVIDAGDIPLPVNTPAVLRLPAGAVASIIVQSTSPGNVSNGTACYSLSATTNAQSLTATVTNTVNISNAAALVSIKSAQSTSIVQPGTSVINYTITTNNIGNQDASGTSANSSGVPFLVDGVTRSMVLLHDSIPAGTQYIAGSLQSANITTVKLFRLPGDAPMSFRSNGDDASAIEVAIGLPVIPATATVSMNFSVLALASAPSTILNSAISTYYSGAQIVDQSSNPVSTVTTTERIGLAKAASQVSMNTNASGTADGTATTTFSLRVKNYGIGMLYNVAVNDVLEGAGAGSTRFGTYTSAPVPLAGQYTIVPGSISISNIVGNTTKASLQNSFTGQSAQSGLVAPGAVLAVGGEFTVQFSVRFSLAGVAPTLYNSALAQAGTDLYGINNVIDTSTNGTDPDPDGDGDPGNNSVPTPVTTVLPTLVMLKTVSPPRPTGTPGTVDVDYQIHIANTSSTPAPNVRLADNLDCAFQMDLPSGPIASWSLLTAPASTTGALVPSANFTGHAACDRTGQSSTNAISSFPSASALGLVDGSRTLAAGQTDQINFTVRITLKPSAIGTTAILTNRAWAAAMTSNSLGMTPASFILASSTSTDLILTDPQGVIYNAVSRLPIAGAVVTMSRTQCRATPVTPIIPAELYFGSSGNIYTFNVDGSVSMTTQADGNYQFFFKTPPVADLCTYHLLVTPPSNSGLAFPSKMIPAQSGTYTGCGLVSSSPTAPQSGSGSAAAPSTNYYTAISAGYDTSNSSSCQVLQNNIPLDPSSLTGLILQKIGSLSTIELNDFMSYTLTLSNNTGATLAGATFTDALPPGFSYQFGTARLNGVPVPDPVGGHGPALTFAFPALSMPGKSVQTLSYRVKAGIGTKINADAINRAQAQSGALASNQAAWRVHVTGGVFSDEAFLFGKVFLDCDSDRIQGHEEVGIPGVRLFLEDGTGVITDVEGKWSLYGLRPVTHALKLDRSSLPEGAQLEILDNRQAGSADSRFVDLKNGEWQKANFAVNNCDNKTMLNDVMARRKYLALHPQAESETARAGSRLDPLGKIATPGDTRGLASTGSITPNGSVALTASSANPLIELPGNHARTGANAPLVPMTPAASGMRDVAQAVHAPGETPSGNGTAETPGAAPASTTSPAKPDTGAAVETDSATASAPALAKLEDLLPVLDNALAFIDLHEGDVLAGSTATVRVKGLRGATFQLSVNGHIVNRNRIGKVASLESNAISAYEYIGVTMQSGHNELLLEALDDVGNSHEKRLLHVVAPGKLTRLETHVPKTAPGDGKTPVKVHVRLLDENGLLITARTPVTLENTLGRWSTEDANPNEPGTQTFITGGSADFELVPPGAPGDARIRISSGMIMQDDRIAFLPDLRPLTGVGILEGVISMHNGAPIGAVMAKDTFESELSGLSRSTGNGNGNAAGRAAFYLKGTIKGEYLLTASYDSDKSSGTQLFRDIQPDKFYPVYGDSSTKVFDAQSSGRLYLRIDKNRSYLLLGDFTSGSSSEVRQLTQVNRTLTGLQHRYENADTRVTSFASRDDVVQQVVEFPANGTSGPFQIGGSSDLLANSEQVQIIVRDRNQPSVVLSSTALTRFTDYSIEPLSRTILFTAPIASLDTNLNPQSIRISFAIASGGPAFWVAGVDAQTKVSEQVQLGVVAAYDGNPANIRRISGVTGLARLSDKTSLATEVAISDSELAGRGQAERVEMHHNDDRLHAEINLAKVGDTFDNPGSTMPAGHTELKASADYKLNDTSSLRSQVLYSRDATSQSEQRGALVSVQTHVSPAFTSEVGLRNGQQTNATGGTFDYGSVTSIGAAASTTASATAPATPTSNNVTSLRARLTANLPGNGQNQVYIEGEQAVDDASRRVLALGGSAQLTDKVRLYGRYEGINSLNGPYTLTTGQSNNIGLLGLDSAYMKDGHSYEELRLADTMDGRSVQAATGVRNTFALGDGWKANAGFERTGNLNTVSGIPGGASVAVTGGMDYLGTGIFKDRMRANISLEVRRGDSVNSTLTNLGMAYKLDQNWSLLTRSITSNTVNNPSAASAATGTATTGASGTSGIGNSLQDRQQIGLAYRPVDTDKWNALARFEHKHVANSNGASGIDPVTGLATLQPEDSSANIVSAHINMQPDAATLIDGRWAAKSSHYSSAGIASSSTAQLVQGRLTRDINPCWDIGVQAAMLWSNSGTRQRSLGLEIGYQVANNMWASIGFNFMGLRDPDLTSNEYTDKGIYLRLRLKFDETVLNQPTPASKHPDMSHCVLAGFSHPDSTHQETGMPTNNALSGVAP